MCDQLSLRSACAYAQSDQSLCLSLYYSVSVKPLTEYHLEVLSLKGGCTGSSESILVKMLYCWKSHVAAQFFLCLQTTDSDGKKLRRITFDQPGNDVTGMVIRSEKIAGTCEQVSTTPVWPRGYKTFFMLNSAEHEIYPAHKC